MQDATLIPHSDTLTSGGSLMALDTSDANVVAELSSELESALKQLQTATDEKAKVNRDLARLQTDLEDRGFWGGLTSMVTGKTDKELAELIKGLGMSLELTQNVVRIMLKVATQKNNVLHSFNNALVEKIAAIQGDTRTLNASQRTIALHFLGELRDQIQQQLSHHALVDSHDVRLDTIDAWQERREALDRGIATQVTALTAGATQAGEALGSLSSQVGAMEKDRQAWQHAKEVADARLATTVGTLSSELDRTHASNVALASHVDSIEEARHSWQERKRADDDAVATLVTTLAARVAVLELEAQQSRTPLRRLVRHLPALIALAAGVVALNFALR